MTKFDTNTLLWSVWMESSKRWEKKLNKNKYSWWQQNLSQCALTKQSISWKKNSELVGPKMCQTQQCVNGVNFKDSYTNKNIGKKTITIWHMYEYLLIQYNKNIYVNCMEHKSQTTAERHDLFTFERLCTVRHCFACIHILPHTWRNAWID